MAELLAIADDPSGPCRGRGIQRVAVSTGPGAFTGLRVGVSMALGVAMARGIAVVGLSSLAVRAAMHPGGEVLALLERSSLHLCRLGQCEFGGPARKSVAA